MLKLSESAAEDTLNDDDDDEGLEEKEKETTEAGMSETINETAKNPEIDVVNATNISNTDESQKPMSEIMETESKEKAPLGIGGKWKRTFGCIALR